MQIVPIASGKGGVGKSLLAANLRFIPGDGELPGIANLGSGQKRKLISRLRGIDADYLVVDLGAGTSFTVMDFFLLSRSGIVITTPTPTALVNAYLCLKSVLSQAIARIADKITELSDNDDEGWLGADESFAMAASEAEVDFEAKSDSVGELLHSGALSYGGLMETVKPQQLEINQLRRQNDLLKSKIVPAARQGFSVR